MTHDELVARATARWPAFGRESALRERLAAQPEAAEELNAEDLYLAVAALGGVTPALAEVQRLLAAQFRAMGHLRLPRATLEDIQSELSGELLVAAPGQSPRLSSYSGRGPLAGWLCIAATRRALDWMRANHREVATDDEALLGSMDGPSEGPEIAQLKQRYMGEFSAAFRRAMKTLEPRQRNLLAQHYLDGLSLDEIAAVYRVHRATAARWLALARSDLLERTRDDLSRALGLGRLEVDSMMRLIQSRLDLSAGIFLEDARA